MGRYSYDPFATQAAPELLGNVNVVYPVVIIGAGPIGLAAAVELALLGVPSVVLDDNNVVSVGSRAICWAKRSLEIFDRLGVADRMVEKGVTWKVGRLFNGDAEVFNFDLLPEDGHKMPAFINLQQYYVEQYLVERAQQFPDLIDLRFSNKVINHQQQSDHITLDVSSDFGDYNLQAEYVLACDGASSPTRKRMGLAFEGQAFEERFLIADVEMESDPFDNQGIPERWFWFKPTFHQGQSALLHKQPDNIYRIDLQLGPDADPEKEKQADVVIPRIQQMVGDKPFKLDWVSVYQFTCAKLDQLVHGRMLFVGDSAHVVSPFGARGGNGGIHDVDNLCWKLAAVLQGRAKVDLLDSYNDERSHGAAENIKHSSRATLFMSPTHTMAMRFRDEVLSMAKTMPFARALINSGRLSSPCSLSSVAQLMLDSTYCDPSPLLGQVAPDAPLTNGDWLLNKLGARYLLLVVSDQHAAEDVVSVPNIPVPHFHVSYAGTVSQRYQKGCYLIRPDQHVGAYWSDIAIGAETVAAAINAYGVST